MAKKRSKKSKKTGKKLSKAHIAKMQAGRKKARRSKKATKGAKVLGTIHGVTVLAKVAK